jgi:hypothetical protein
MNVTYLSNIISTKSSLNCPFELVYGERLTLHNNLKMFGEVGVVTAKEKIQAKLSFRIMLVEKLVWDMTCTVVDIETAFLHKIWMKKYTWKFLN